MPSSPEPAPQLDGLPPELVNHPSYEVVRELYRDETSVAFLARNRRLPRFDVLKVLKKELVDNHGTVERLAREIKAACALGHPNVATVYPPMCGGECFVYVMEFVDGDDLARHVASRGPLPVVNACYFAYQAAKGLQHAHESGIVHRDIKPANLLLLRQGKTATIKIAGFGLAAVVSGQGFEDGPQDAEPPLGTIHFIAPEHARDAQKCDIRGDLYSLGCTLYYLLAGRPPFAGAGTYEILQAHQAQDPAPLSKLRPDVSLELAAVLKKMMAKQPERRFQTAAELAQALKPIYNPASAAPGASQPELAEAEFHPTPAPPTPIAPLPAPPQRSEPTPDAGSELLIEFEPENSAARMAVARIRQRQRGTWLIGSLALGALAAALVGTWASGVFKAKPRESGVILQNLPEQAQVQVDGNHVAVHKSEVDGTAEIVMPPGLHDVRVAMAGFKTLDNQVIVEANKKQQVELKFVPRPVASSPKNAGSPDIDSTDDERIAANGTPATDAKPAETPAPHAPDPATAAQPAPAAPAPTSPADPKAEAKAAAKPAEDAKPNTASDAKPAAEPQKNVTEITGEASTDSQPFFNRKDLAGWDGPPGIWRVEKEAIVGSIPSGQQAQAILVSKETYKDFDLKFLARLADGGGTCSLRFRSQRKDPGTFTITGPRCEIDGKGSAKLLTQTAGKEEAIPARTKTKRAFRQGNFNHYQIRCEGKHVTVKVNGVTTIDNELPSVAAEGLFAWELDGSHPPREATFKVIKFTDLSRSQMADASKRQTIYRPGLLRAERHFVDLTSDANQKLLKQFDVKLKELENKKTSDPERSKLISAIQAEKEDFTKKGLFPWSRPMRVPLSVYWKATVAARQELEKAFNTAIDDAERKHDEKASADLLAEEASFMNPHVIAVSEFTGARGRVFRQIFHSDGVYLGDADHTSAEESAPTKIWWIEGDLLILAVADAAAEGGYKTHEALLAADGKTYLMIGPKGGKQTWRFIDEIP